MIMRSQAGDKLMSLTDVSEMLGIPIHALYRRGAQCRRANWPSRRPHPRYGREAVEAWLEQ
jgi:hypothetical protein